MCGTTSANPFAGVSGSCSRIRYCSRPVFARTLPTDGRRRALMPSRRLPGMPARMTSSWHCQTVTTRLSEKEVAHSLALTARECATSFSDNRVVTVWQCHDEVMRAGMPGSRLDGIKARLRPSVGNVLANTGREQYRILEHEPDTPAKGFALVVPHIDAIDHDRAVLRLVQPKDQADEAGFPDARRTYQCHLLPRMNVKRHVVEEAVSSVISEGDVPEDNVAGKICGCNRIRRVTRLFLDRQHLLDAASTNVGSAHSDRGFPQIADGLVDRFQVGHEDQQIPGCHVAFECLPGAEQERNGRAERADHLYHPGNSCGRARRSDALGQISRGFPLKTVLLELAATKRLNHGDGAENLVHAGGNPSFLLALPADRGPALMTQPGEGDKQHGDAAKHDQGQSPVDDDHDDQHSADHRGLVQGPDTPVRKQIPDRRRVAGHLHYELA